MTTTRTTTVTLTLILLLSTLLVPAWSAQAALPADPYADVVDPSTSPKVLSREHALGAPDGKLATVVGIHRSDLVLDMGDGEEGTGALTVHYGVTLAVNPTVEFLDEHYAVLVSQAVPLSPTKTTVTIAYPPAPTPYRYVRFGAAATAYTIDAIAAATYRPDSDQDSLPDSWELQYGLDPLDPAGANGAAGDPDSDGLTNADERTAATNPTRADTDGDGLSDRWEVDQGLDPVDATGNHGAQGDPDTDGLTNVQECAAGTNPTNPDMDGDGLPDGWEVQHGMNPLDPTGTNGAAGDPDDDGLTNTQEFVSGTNPSMPDQYFVLLPLVLR